EVSGARPNVIIILADDLGWSDLGCYGNKFNEYAAHRPSGAEGMRFTQFYAGSPVCAPSTPGCAAVRAWRALRSSTTTRSGC
ncbi:MAG: sulfatase-like hydrolase/transferase, partial [Aquincola sp.]|nr:sulfatase-like hydrolase/transferase [Aquincola sp.]